MPQINENIQNPTLAKSGTDNFWLDWYIKGVNKLFRAPPNSGTVMIIPIAYIKLEYLTVANSEPLNHKLTKVLYAIIKFSLATPNIALPNNIKEYWLNLPPKAIIN